MSCPARSVSHRVDVLDGEPLAGLTVHAGNYRSERPLPQEIEHRVSIAQFAHVSIDIACRGALHYCRAGRLAFDVQRTAAQHCCAISQRRKNNLQASICSNLARRILICSNASSNEAFEDIKARRVGQGRQSVSTSGDFAIWFAGYRLYHEACCWRRVFRILRWFR